MEEPTEQQSNDPPSTEPHPQTELQAAVQHTESQQTVEQPVAPQPTGNQPKHGKWPSWTGFSGKTAWDWLQLLGVLAIPLVVAGATLLFSIQQANLAQQQHTTEQKIANQQHEADKQSALDQQQAAILQTYIDNIQDLLLHDNLLRSKPTDEVAILARARTLTALQGLDPVRKGRLMAFIYEAKLISFEDGKDKTSAPIINLNGADLTGADLKDANLNGANLTSTILRYAELNGANLTIANLNGANLNGADLTGATLTGATLRGATLRNATLRGVGLGSADLLAADLTGAFLGYAELIGADLDYAFLVNADLRGVHHLTQQQLDQVYTCKGAILPTGLTCNHN